MFKLFGTLLVGILSASLAVIYQNDIAAFLGRASVTVQVTAGGWYPHPITPDAVKNFSETDENHIASFGNPKEESFARLIITNNTARDIDNSVIRISDDGGGGLWKYDAVILTKRNGKVERTVVEEADQINVGSLPAAQDTVVYLWSDRGFGYPWNLSDVEILTTEGKVPRTIANLRGSSTDVFLGISTETIAWVFVFLLAILCGIILYALHHSFSFAKAMLKDEDYYLSERVRYDSDPQKFTVPDALPKS